MNQTSVSPVGGAGGAAAHPIELRNVEAAFEGVIQVLRSISLEVRQGQIVSLIGGNGAGKTTTLKAISSLLGAERGRVVEGKVMLSGQDMTNADPCDVVRQGTVQVLEGRKVLHHLTVAQNLLAGAHFRDDRQAVERDLQEMLATFPKLELLRDRPAGYLSGGEMQMLLVSRALMAAPRVLLLDEPSMGLAPRVVQELFDAIRSVCRQRGISVLLVEQNVRAALQISDYGYVMENGRIVLAGSREALEGNQDVREFYLGLGSAEGKTSYREVKHYRRRKRWLG